MNTDTRNLSDTTLVVTGMTCGHCVNAVRSLLAEVSGVTVRTVSVGVAVIATAEPQVVSQAMQTLNNAGYCATIVRPSAPSNSGCCCGGGDRCGPGERPRA